MITPTRFCQAAWVVPDLHAAMERWVKVSRVGPFFVNPEVKMEKARYRGRPTSIPVRIGLAQAGPIQIELIEQMDDTPSVYRDSVAFGQERFHHMAAFVDDVDAEIARYVAGGADLAYDGYFGNVRIGYLDTRKQLGFMVELFDHKPGMDEFFAYIAAQAEQWDSSDPIRQIPQA
jgi:hypothetical protein